MVTLITLICCRHTQVIAQQPWVNPSSQVIMTSLSHWPQSCSPAPVLGVATGLRPAWWPRLHRGAGLALQRSCQAVVLLSRSARPLIWNAHTGKWDSLAALFPPISLSWRERRLCLCVKTCVCDFYKLLCVCMSTWVFSTPWLLSIWIMLASFYDLTMSLWSMSKFYVGRKIDGKKGEERWEIQRRKQHQGRHFIKIDHH